MVAFQNCGGGGGGSSGAGSPVALATCDTLFFASLTGVALSSVIDSDTVTFSNCTEPVTITVSGDGAPQFYKNGAPVAGSFTVTSGDTLRVQLTSSALQNVNYQATVSIGDFTSVFSITTGDFTPSSFTFAPATGRPLNANVTSAQTTLSGFDGTLTATASGDGAPVILVNGAAVGSSASIQAGNAVSVRLISSASENTTRQAIVTIGGVSASFDVTTIGDATAPSVTSVTSPAVGSYKQATNLDFAANFTEPVTVTGAPRLSLNVGGALKYATYLSGSGTAALIFRYTVEAATNDGDGLVVGSFQLNGGNILDSSGNVSDLSFLPLLTSGVIVDTVASTVSSATAPANGNYSVGQNLNFTLTFNEVVNVSGTPRLTLTVGSTTRYADYLSGSGTSALQFRYVILTGDTDADGIAVSPNIDLNGGALADIATNAADLNFTAPNTAGVKVHEYPLSCKEIKTVLSSSLDGTYTIDPDDGGPTAPVVVYCNMSRDGGGWTSILKSWAYSGIGTTAAEGSALQWDLNGGVPFKLSDTSIRSIVGPSQNYDVMADQVGYVGANSTGNFEYVILRNYTGLWRFDTVMPASTTITEMSSYRASDHALAWTGNFQCGTAGSSARGLNCNSILTNNPQGGAGCTINMGLYSNVAWHHFTMFHVDSDSYLFVCNSAQYSSASPYGSLKHRWYVRERN